MKAILVAVVAIVLSGCASYAGRGLAPGQSSAAEVEAVMGPPAERSHSANGETVLWFPRFPFGRESYAARIGPDGKLIAIEQRLTPENVARLQPGRTTAKEVRPPRAAVARRPVPADAARGLDLPDDGDGSDAEALLRAI